MYNFQVIVLDCLGWVFRGINYKLLPLHPEAEETFERHVNDSWLQFQELSYLLWSLISKELFSWIELNKYQGELPLEPQNVTFMFLKDTCCSPSYGAIQNSIRPLKTALELSNTRESQLAGISTYTECVFMLMTLMF